MKRTEAEALLLVNWKGVPYRRYELDPGVTALEGANGAGKTTVMIAAYVVLMPDMTKLRFTNIGEHDRSGGDRGVFGRLGVRDRPSYAALDLRLASGQRLVAGVQLERGAEPTVKLESFLVHGLRDDVALQALFLDRLGAVDSVPVLSRVKELVALAGGRLEHFASAREYFVALFDQGVTPLRLAVEEERGKFNDMLHTSMVGGISKMLGTGLRAFLFREESGLADTLRTMKRNLDECRSTRREVTESQRIESELRGVYEPGRRVFAAALLATRQQAQELRNAMDAARRDHDGAAARHQARYAELLEAQARASDLERRLATLEEAYQIARDRLELVTKARGLSLRLQQLLGDTQEARTRFDTVRALSEAADELLERARMVERTAAENRDRAADGLADAEKGVLEFARRAGLHRLAITAKGSAERLLSREIDPVALPAIVREVGAGIEALDTRTSALDTALRQAEVRRREFFAVHAALVRVLQRDVDPPTAFEAASEALRRGRELEGLAADRSRVERDRKRAASIAHKQKDARDRARRLSTPLAPIHTQAEVVAAHEEAQKAAEASRKRCEEARARIARFDQEASSTEEKARALEPLRNRWRFTRELAARLTVVHGVELRDGASVDALQARLDAERDSLKRAIGDDERRTGELSAALQALEFGGSRDESLQSVAEKLGGEWLADRFDDVELEDAPRLEAQLGPLRDALVVESPEAAATALAQGEKLPGTVWLVDADATAALRRVPEHPSSGHVVVRSEAAWRVTPLPERPVLGRRARLRRIEELRAELAAASERLVVARGKLRQIDSARADASTLHSHREELEKPDPELEITLLLSEATKRRTEASVVRDSLPALDFQEHAGRAREREFLELLGMASLLDDTDAVEELAALERRLEEISLAERELARTRRDVALLSVRLEALREAPISEDDRVRMEGELGEKRTDRDRLFRARANLLELDRHREALPWTDAEEALAERQALAPGLKAALESAKVALADATRARETAEAESQRLRSDLNGADAAWKSRAAERDRVEEELSALHVPEASEQSVESARTQMQQEGELAAVARREHGVQQLSVGRLDADTSAAAKEEYEKAQFLRQKEASSRPAQERWEKLEFAAREARVYDEAIAEVPNLPEGNAIHLWQARTTPRAQLLERLRKAHDGADLADLLADRLSPSGDEPQGAVYLEAWLELRGWLSRRVPAQISEGADPVRALQALGEHLAQLADRLSVQEQQLRGEASSVAASIRAATQKAATTVRKLNQDLRDVSFGSITSVQLRCERNEQMDKVLRALGGEAGQTLFFHSETPFEDALNQLFDQYGGGRSAGHRLLDYREYLDLRVEVTRRGSTAWETANPTRLSTGEAIGVGAAVMIVVLGAWERDAQFIRGKRTSASLRFLFLDEASRLDKDTLGNLFELCSRLGLQLLIAAPEVARAESNTTYRLVRKVDAEGREGVDVVEVSGRRRRSTEAA